MGVRLKIQLSRFGVVSLLLLATNACVIDSQRIVSKEDFEVANPKPTSRNFLGNNARHKLLMGVIDTGVDYNHPLLADHLHFELDKMGSPIRLGKDYVGEDNWPSPYIVRTSKYDQSLSEDDRSAASKTAGQISRLIKKAPGLAKYLDPRRNVSQESSEGAYHGTHVAGLMVYDRPDFGLMAYRMLPTNRHPEEDHNYTAETVKQIVDSIDQAAADGARVVNMSIGLDFEKAVKNDDSNKTIETAKEMRDYLDQVTAAVKRHPEVLFVSAAGNDGAWRDDENRLGMPCGVRAPNMLCVGALRENGDPATFTNISVSGADIVFALGHRVLSTMPLQMCTSDVVEGTGDLTSDSTEEDIDKLIDKLKSNCLKENGLGMLSGTSMASPIVAHQAGLVLAAQPQLKPEQVIQTLYRQAIPSFIGTVPVYKLRIAKPSWYFRKTGASMLDDIQEESAYFEGYLPAPGATK